MDMLKRFARLFTIKTRLEAYLVTYAIAVGAIERGIHYMQNYPGNGGILLACACLGVPFIAGAKLLDSVRPAPQPALAPAPIARHRIKPRRLSRSLPKGHRSARGSTSPTSHRID